MQYRRSTLFLIFFFVAATLALFGVGGICFAIFGLLLALFVNKTEFSWTAVLSVVSAFGILVALLLPAVRQSREIGRRERCVQNLVEIGQSLHRYYHAHGHFPLPNIKNQSGQELYSWRVEILPDLEYGTIYDQLKKEEPWDSPHNQNLLDKNRQDYGCSISEYWCPNDPNKVNSSSYVSVIGPGTAWHEDKPINLVDLPDGGKYTVMLLEMLNRNKNWGQPDHLTVDELTEQLGTEEGRNTLSGHSTIAFVLFADGSVWRVTKEMPIPLWQKILAGEAKSIDSETLSQFVLIDYYASPTDRFFAFLPNGPILCAIPVWLCSVVLLFRRAVKSRKVIPQASAGAT
jgi:hypothetical protein